MSDSIDLMAILIVTICHVIGGIAAFGSALLSIPILVLWWGPDHLQKAVFFVLTLGLLQALMLYVRNWRYTKLSKTWVVHVPALAAIPLGVVLVDVIPRTPVIALLASIILVTALYNLRTFRSTTTEEFEVHTSQSTQSLTFGLGFIGGMVHGAFGVGGSVLVITMQRATPEPHEFRAAMSLLWLILGAMFLLFMPQSTAGIAPDLFEFLVAGAGVVTATIFGDIIAKKASRLFFQRLVAILLLLSAGSLYLSL